MAEQEQLLSKSIIGVIVAILGNIGIAVALNMQKRAHNSLKLKMEMVEERRRRRTGAESGVNEHSTDTLIQGLSLGGGGEEVVLSMTEEEEDSPLLLSDEDHATLPSTSPHLGDDQRDKYISGNGNDTQASYLSSKLWWLGLLVMILGELGNFIAYGFAPAVLVAPLGTVALISNILIAPLFLGESIQKEDLYGISSSVLGTFIILAVSSNTNEPTLSADDIIKAIMQLNFLVYLFITLVLLFCLYRYSISEVGERYLLVDLMIAGILGGYTVLSIKALSSLLKMNMYTMLAHWITYCMIAILVFTGIFQIHFLNKALSRFNSVEVIPTNFVIFTTCSIIASSVLYGDLERTSPFALLGVFLMFLGVVLITFKHNRQPLPSSSMDPASHQSVIAAEEQVALFASPPLRSATTAIPHPNFSFLSSPLRDQALQYQQRQRISSSLEHRTQLGAYRRLSGILTSVGSSVGTHSVRRMEFEHLSDLAHASSSGLSRRPSL